MLSVMSRCYMKCMPFFPKKCLFSTKKCPFGVVPLQSKFRKKATGAYKIKLGKLVLLIYYLANKL